MPGIVPSFGTQKECCILESEQTPISLTGDQLKSDALNQMMNTTFVCKMLSLSTYEILFSNKKNIILIAQNLQSIKPF